MRTVASELVSNVVQHTSDGGIVRAWDPKPDKPFHLRVTDSNIERPNPPQESNDSGGRGLRIVSELSDDWGVDIDDVGKTVWESFSRPDGDAPESAEPTNG